VRNREKVRKKSGGEEEVWKFFIIFDILTSHNIIRKLEVLQTTLLLHFATLTSFITEPHSTNLKHINMHINIDHFTQIILATSISRRRVWVKHMG
jgi:hypothetical protein